MYGSLELELRVWLPEVGISAEILAQVDSILSHSLCVSLGLY